MPRTCALQQEANPSIELMPSGKLRVLPVRGLTVALYESFDRLPDQRYVCGSIFTKEAEPEVQAWHRSSSILAGHS